MIVVCIEEYKSGFLLFEKNVKYEIEEYNLNGIRQIIFKIELKLPGAKCSYLKVEEFTFNEYFQTLAVFRSNRIKKILK